MTAPQACWPRCANCTLIARTPSAPARHDQGPGPAISLTWAFVVERVTRIELALSAWEVSATIRGLPAETLACGTLARLTASDRELPPSLTQSGTQRARPDRERFYSPLLP